MHGVDRLNWWLIHVLINRTSQWRLSKLSSTTYSGILLLIFCLIFNDSSTSQPQLIIIFFLWFPLFRFFSLRLLTCIKTTAFISLRTFVILSALLFQVDRALIDFNFAHYTLMLFVLHFLWTTVGHLNRICLIGDWRYTLFIAWLCFSIFANHSLQRRFFIHERYTGVLNWRLLLYGDLICLVWVHVCPLISSSHIYVSLLSFDDRAKVCKSILTSDVVALSSKDRVK